MESQGILFGWRDPWRLVFTPLLSALLAASLQAQEVQTQEKEKILPVFKDGEAQVVEGFSDPKEWIRHDLWVETEFDSDGDGKRDRVHVDVTRPSQTETEGLKVPVVYESSPYYSGTGSTARNHFWDPRQEVGAKPPEREIPPEIPHRQQRSVISNSLVREWVPRGFAVVHSESPGTGWSQGCPTTGGANEALAPKAVIDWLNGRVPGYTSVGGDEKVEATWCTGKVGMTGTSYNGTLAVAAASTGVKGLEAIIPDAPNTSYYLYYRSNGLVRHPGGWMGEDIDVLYDFIHSGFPDRREWCNCNIRDGLLRKNFDRVSGDLNGFWAGRDYLVHADSMRAATLVSHGFNDWNVMPEHSVRVYEALKARGVPVQAYFHQGGHGGPPTPTLMNRWFTRYLYGVENGVEKEPRAWIVREGAQRSEPTPYADYPNPKAAPATLHLRAGGSAIGGLALEASPGQGREKLVDDFAFSGTLLAQADHSENRLLYATPELKVPVHLSGRSRITIKLASSKPAANLSVWVVSLPWTKSRRINDNLINRGWADPQNHDSLTKGEPLKPGEFYELAFELQPDDQIIPAGQSIGLMIFSSDRDFTLWPPPGTELTVDLDATRLEIPVVGGAEALEKAF